MYGIWIKLEVELKLRCSSHFKPIRDGLITPSMTMIIKKHKVSVHCYNI